MTSLSNDTTNNSGSNNLYAQSVYEFVDTFVKPHFEAPVLDTTSSSVRWCSKWADHPQAMLILEGLWRSYEEARAADMVNHGGQSTINYLVGHFYPLMDRLTGSFGPFRRCHPGQCAGPTKLGDQLDPENLVDFN